MEDWVMGLSRRQFTKEFKLAALQRLEMGTSVAEVARAFEVNPNVLHRWRCELAGVSRAGLYRCRPRAPGPDPHMALRDAIQRIALEFPSYGWPRITAELKRRGWRVNHKRVYRSMREDNLLCLRRRKFVVTTDSNHS